MNSHLSRADSNVVLAVFLLSFWEKFPQPLNFLSPWGKIVAPLATSLAECANGTANSEANEHSIYLLKRFGTPESSLSFDAFFSFWFDNNATSYTTTKPKLVSHCTYELFRESYLTCFISISFLTTSFFYKNSI